MFLNLRQKQESKEWYYMVIISLLNPMKFPKKSLKSYLIFNQSYIGIFKSFDLCDAGKVPERHCNIEDD